MSAGRSRPKGMRVKPQCDCRLEIMVVLCGWLASAVGFGAVGRGDRVGDQGDVAVVEVAQRVAQPDRQVGAEAGRDAQQVGLGAGAGQLALAQSGDRGSPADGDGRGAGGVAVAGEEELFLEVAAAQPDPVGDDEVDRGGVGEAA